MAVAGPARLGSAAMAACWSAVQVPVPACPSDRAVVAVVVAVAVTPAYPLDQAARPSLLRPMAASVAVVVLASPAEAVSKVVG